MARRRDAPLAEKQAVAPNPSLINVSTPRFLMVVYLYILLEALFLFRALARWMGERGRF